MADSLLTQMVTEIGAVMGTITTANGFSQTIPAGAIVFDNIDLFADTTTDPDAFPRVEIVAQNIGFQDITPETHESTFAVEIRSYLLLDKHLTDDLGDQKLMFNFSADIRKALISTYDRQSAGSFVMPEFLQIQNIFQKFWTDANVKDVLGVITDVDYSFDADFDVL